MSVATDARAEYERMMAIADHAILTGKGEDLLEGDTAVEAHEAAAGYRETVEKAEAAEGLRWDGHDHQRIS